MVVKENKEFNMNKFARVLLVAFLVAGVVWFFRTEIGGIINRVPSNPAIIFPEVQSRAIVVENFDNGNVAIEVNQFIMYGAEKKALWSLDYADVDLNDTKGLELIYELDQTSYNLIEFYKEQINIAKNNNWKLLAGNIEDSRMFLDIQRNNATADYKVRIFAEQNGGPIEIKVQFLITRI